MDKIQEILNNMKEYTQSHYIKKCCEDIEQALSEDTEILDLLKEIKKDTKILKSWVFDLVKDKI